ncbi:ETS-family transcription factor [Elysia marginata]|uniref:ETS-family transcription factor n=1 Tax=Elysia marginata TaxID=1093978 RepID=A0AAV4IMA3_9GAST|nr:ETS-family transcription factor [Elysia marginata]
MEVMKVVIEEPRRAPSHSTLHTFNYDNHWDIKNLNRDIYNGLFSDPRGSALNNSTHGPATGVGQPQSSVQISSNTSYPQWRPSERARHSSCKAAVPDSGSSFDTGRANKDLGDNADALIVYEYGGDGKVVGIQGLGDYPIDKDFSPWLSQTFTAPLSPIISPPCQSQFDQFNEPSSQALIPISCSAHAPPTPPLSHRSSLSSPSSCPGPSPTWFLPPQSPRLFGTSSRNATSFKRQHSNSCGEEFKPTVCPNRPSSLLPSRSSSEDTGANGITTGQTLTNSLQEIPSESPLSSSTSSYHFQKTMTTTLCRQNVAVTGPFSQEMQSHTFSSSWTVSSSNSSSSLFEQENKFHSSSTSLSPSSSSPVWHESIASKNLEETASASFMPTTVNADPMEDSMFTNSPDEDQLAMEYEAFVTADVKKKAPRRSRNGSSKTGNHLWEFVRDLLRDPKFNPKLLKWEDKENGVFRFVQSEQVARLWGEKKNNPMMTYEKLSRAMRFCRKTGFFNAVPRTGKFPKKLCFMFGEKAHGWKD